MYDICIIGAGVVGCSILNKLTRHGVKCIMVEKCLDVSVGASKANSGLIHAGFDCTEGSLKARLNVEGNRLYYKMAKDLGVEAIMTGAVVAGDDRSVLDALYERGLKNGLSKNELEVVDRAKLVELVPNIADHIKYALHAKTAGIVSPYSFAIALAEEAVLNGAEVRFGFDVNRVESKEGLYIVSSDRNESVQAKIIINAAGFGYNKVAKAIGAEVYEIYHKRGEYFVLDHSEAALVPMTVFPMPSAISKGILVTPTSDGNILLGPTSYECDYDTKTTTDGLAEIRAKTPDVVKNIAFNKAIRVFSGVRSSSRAGDFIIEKSKLKNNIINLAGIDSPGLTSAPAIANYVASLLELKSAEKKMIKRKPYTDINKLTAVELNALIKKDSDYGKIVCRCENVTLGQIKEAILSPLQPRTVDAIKRRVRAGMGRCQGGFCFMKVIQAIADNYNIKIDDVCKEAPASNFIVDDIKG